MSSYCEVCQGDFKGPIAQHHHHHSLVKSRNVSPQSRRPPVRRTSPSRGYLTNNNNNDVSPSLSPVLPGDKTGLLTPLSQAAVEDILNNIKNVVRSEAQKVLQQNNKEEESNEKVSHNLVYSREEEEEGGATSGDPSPSSFTFMKNSQPPHDEYFVTPMEPFHKSSSKPKKIPYPTHSNHHAITSEEDSTASDRDTSVELAVSPSPPREDVYHRQLRLQLQTQSIELREEVGEVRQRVGELCTAVREDLRVVTDRITGVQLQTEQRLNKVEEIANKTKSEAERTEEVFQAFQNMSKEQLKKMAAVLLPYLLPALQEELDQRREEDREWSTVECARQLAEREQHRYDRTEDTVPVGFTSLAEMEEHMQCVARAVLAAEDERRRQRQVQEDARREERHTRQQEELRGELHRLKHSLMGEVEQRARAQEDTLTALQSQLTKLTRRQSTTKVIVDSNNNNNNVLLECQPLTAHVRRLLASHQQLIDVVVERRCAAVLEQVEGERHRYDLQNTDLRTRLQTLRNDTRHALTEMSRNLNIAAPGL